MNLVKVTHIWLLIGTSFASLTRNKPYHFLVDFSQIQSKISISNIWKSISHAYFFWKWWRVRSNSLPTHTTHHPSYANKFPTFAFHPHDHENYPATREIKYPTREIKFPFSEITILIEKEVKGGGGASIDIHIYIYIFIYKCYT